MTFPSESQAIERDPCVNFAYLDERTKRMIRRALLKATGVSVCSRVHFGRPQSGEREHFLRFAYSGIDSAQIAEGLTRLRAYLEGEQSHV